MYVNIINPLTSQGEVVTVFTYPYLSAGASEQSEAKGLNLIFNTFYKLLINLINIKLFYNCLLIFLRISKII